MEQSYNAVVIGAGSWGTALAYLLSHTCDTVTLSTRNQESAELINHDRKNPKYLKSLVLPTNVHASHDLSVVEQASCIVFAIPSSAFRETSLVLASTRIPPESAIVSVAKGIELKTGLRMTEVIGEQFPNHAIAALSGPNHAEEVVQNLPTCSVIACQNEEKKELLQTLFSSPTFRSYTSSDVIGVEWGGAVKNTYAIAAGIAKGLQLGDNAIAALVTRALAEMKRIGLAVGAQKETFSGLSGVGDLMTTCYSPHSRNHQVGLSLAKGLSVEDAVNTLGMVAEGVPNTRSIYQKSRQLGVETPLIDAVYAILYEQKSAAEALKELLNREPRSEE